MQLLIYILVLGMLSAWEEVQQLIQRGSWKREDYRYPEWKTDYNSIWKNFDSHHFAFGLFVLIMMITFHTCKNSITIEAIPLLAGAYKDIASIIIYWFGFFYVRNIGLHIIFKRKPIYSYLLFWKMK